MALPKAVQAIGDAAEAAAVTAGIKPGEQPVADPGNPAPAATVTPIAPEPQATDWEKQHKNYKAATDKTIHELRQGREGDQQAIGRLSAQLEALQKQMETLTTPAVEPATPASNPDDVDLSVLPEEIRDGYDEKFLKGIARLVNPSLMSEIKALRAELDDVKGSVSQQTVIQEKTATQLYEEALDIAFPNDLWIQLTQGEQWQEFCRKQPSPYVAETYGQIVAAGAANHDAHRVIQVLKDYQTHQTALEAQPAPVVVDPLESQLTPDSGSGDGGDPVSQLNAQAETFTVTQVNQFFNDVATTKKYTAEQAAAIEKQIVAAQAAGKIIPG